MKNLIYWIGLGLLVLPAIIGLLASSLVLLLASALYFIICVITVIVLVVCCVPVVIWCGFFDSDNFNRLRTITGKADLN